MAAAGSAGKVGIKISPAMAFNDCPDPNPGETYGELVRAIAPMGLSYLHVMGSAGFDVAQLRPLFKGPFFLGGGYDRVTAEAGVVSGEADAIVFGKLYVSNPDLVARFGKGAALADADGATFYTPGERGYTDYLALG